MMKQNFLGQSTPLQFQQPQIQQRAPQQPPQNMPSQPPRFEWDKVVSEFSNWHPANEAELTYFRDAHEFLINRLM